MPAPRPAGSSRLRADREHDEDLGPVVKERWGQDFCIYFLKSFYHIIYFVKNQTWDDDERLNYRTWLHSKLNIKNSFGTYLFLYLKWNRIWMQDSILCSEE